jgi:alanine racemase
VTTTLEFLKQQLAQVEDEIAPLEKVRETLKQQIRQLQSSATLAAYGLAVGDALRVNTAFIAYNRIMEWERGMTEGRTLYISGLNDEQVVLSKYQNGGGVAYGATFEMAQCMKAAYQVTP